MMWSNLTLKNGEICEPGYATKIGCAPGEGAGEDGELLDEAGVDLALDGSWGSGADNVIPPLCRGRSSLASSTSRPYLMMSSSPGAAVGAGKAETSGKSASAAAQGTETFIGCERTR